MKLLCVLLCISACQEQTENARVRAIVAKLIPPQTGKPKTVVNMNKVLIELKEAGPQEGKEMAAPVQVRRRIEDYAVKSECFDNWIFGNLSDKDARKDWLERHLEERLNGMGVLYHLNESQISKLFLAGKGDIKRYFDVVEAKRMEFEEIRQHVTKGQAFLQSTHDIAGKFTNGPFFQGSLFEKTLTKILDDRKSR
jgi:hypothetical protein